MEQGTMSSARDFFTSSSTSPYPVTAKNLTTIGTPPSQSRSYWQTPVWNLKSIILGHTYIFCILCLQEAERITVPSITSWLGVTRSSVMRWEMLRDGETMALRWCVNYLTAVVAQSPHLPIAIQMKTTTGVSNYHHSLQTCRFSDHWIYWT